MTRGMRMGSGPDALPEGDADSARGVGCPPGTGPSKQTADVLADNRGERRTRVPEVLLGLRFGVRDALCGRPAAVESDTPGSGFSSVDSRCVKSSFLTGLSGPWSNAWKWGDANLALLLDAESGLLVCKAVPAPSVAFSRRFAGLSRHPIPGE